MSKKRVLLPLLPLTLLLLLAGGWLVMRALRPPFVPPTLPVPNGFDELLRAAQMLHPRTGFYDEMDAEELAQVVGLNTSALKVARAALEQPCGVAVDWSRDPANQGVDPAMLDQVQAMRSLCRAFLAESRFQLEQGNSDAAVAAGIDAYRLGTQCNNGGLMVGHLVAIAIRNAAIDELRQIILQDPNRRATVLAQLLPLLELGESVDEVTQRELAYIEYASRGFTGWITVRGTRGLLESSIESARQSDHRITATERLFATHLALHVYRNVHGNWPARLEELAADYPATMTLDPYDTQPFRYRIEGEGYLLYSVGENGIDDNGVGDATGQALDVVYELDGGDP